MTHSRSLGMKANVGTTDRAICIVVGLGLIGATPVGAIGAWGWLWPDSAGDQHSALLPGISAFRHEYLPLETAGTVRPYR
jgi:hypothetical protein